MPLDLMAFFKKKLTMKKQCSVCKKLLWKNSKGTHCASICIYRKTNTLILL